MMAIRTSYRLVCGLPTLVLRGQNKTAGNKVFAIARVSCFAETFVEGGSSVLRMKFSAKTPRHRKAPKRYLQPVTTLLTLTDRQKT